MECVGPVSYVVQLLNGAIWRRHVDHIRKGTDRTEASSDTTEHFPVAIGCPVPLAANHDTPDVVNTSEPEDTPMSAYQSSELVRTYPKRSHRPPERLYGTMDS